MNTQHQLSNTEQARPDVSATDCCGLTRRESNQADTGVLDIEELQNRCMGNLDLVRRVLDKFHSRFPEEMLEIQNALGAGDTELASRVAHRVKGTSASVSAKGLAEAAAELEELTRSKSGTNFTVCVNRLNREWERFQNEMETTASNHDKG